MFCVSCGKQVEEGSEFCRHCGANQAGDSRAVVATAGAQIAKVARAEFLGLRLGERVMAIGAVVATVSFFLPWAKEISMFGGGQGGPGVNGPGLMKVWGAIVFLLLLPLLSLFLLYLSKSAPPGRKMFLAGFQIWIGGTVGPQVVIGLLFVPLATNLLAGGAWGIGLGYSAVLVGALMLLGDLGRQMSA
jgi:hypothetical protein